MEFARSKEIDIISTIDQIDQLLISLDIIPVLHYKSIEYRLRRNDNPLMTIKLSTSAITFIPLYHPEMIEDQKCFAYIKEVISTSIIYL